MASDLIGSCALYAGSKQCRKLAGSASALIFSRPAQRSFTLRLHVHRVPFRTLYTEGFSRDRLKPRSDCYWQRLAEGAYLGFRRGPDTWHARFRGKDGKQQYQPLGEALGWFLDDDGSRRTRGIRRTWPGGLSPLLANPQDQHRSTNGSPRQLLSYDRCSRCSGAQAFAIVVAFRRSALLMSVARLLGHLEWGQVWRACSGRVVVPSPLGAGLS